MMVVDKIKGLCVLVSIHINGEYFSDELMPISLNDLLLKIEEREN
jgi:hypothetical protein